MAISKSEYLKGLGKVKDYIDSKSSQSDWGENNPESPAYIKNRTHWVEYDNGRTIVESQTLNFEQNPYTSAISATTENDNLFMPPLFDDLGVMTQGLEVGKLTNYIIIIIDGTEHKCKLQGTQPMVMDAPSQTFYYINDNHTVGAIVKLYDDLWGDTEIFLYNEIEGNHEVEVIALKAFYHPLHIGYVYSNELEQLMCEDKVIAPEKDWEFINTPEGQNLYLGTNDNGDYGWHDLPTQTTNIPTLTSQLTNDSGFLTEHQDISHLATKEELSAKTLGEVVILGDSLSSGYGIPDGTKWSDKLLSEGVASNVYNYASSGATLGNYAVDTNSVCILNQYQQMKNENVVPDVIVVEFGANDSFACINGKTTYNNVRTTFENFISTIMTDFPNTKIIYVSTNDTNEMKSISNYKHASYNFVDSILKTVCADKQIRCVSLLSGVTIVPSEVQADGIHPTKSAVERIGLLMCDKLLGSDMVYAISPVQIFGQVNDSVLTNPFKYDYNSILYLIVKGVDVIYTLAYNSSYNMLLKLSAIDTLLNTVQWSASINTADGSYIDVFVELKSDGSVTFKSQAIGGSGGSTATDSHINGLIDVKLGVIENGTY